MVRAFAVCAVILAACTASAQTVTPRIISQPAPNEDNYSDQGNLYAAPQGIELYAAPNHIATPQPTPVSACDEHGCPSSTSIATTEKPVDKHALLKQKLAEMNCLQSEIDQLRAATGAPQQILVKIQAFEVSRTKLQKLGLDIPTALGRKQDKGQQPFTPPNQPNGSAAEVISFNDSKEVQRHLDKLRQGGIGMVRAEPNIVVTCGRPAAFNVGGEVPMPTAPGSDQAVEYKPFGTQVDLLATAQGNNRVHLEFRARISEIDDSRTITVAGVTVPGITVRQVATSQTLMFGQTGVVFGMVQPRIQTVKKGDKTVAEVDEIELLFLITPESVSAISGEKHVADEGGGTVRTADAAVQPMPGEKSLRVTTPNRRR